MLAAAALLLASAALAQVPDRPDTTWVRTFDEEFINWATPHTMDFNFPADAERYGEVLLYVTIGCPGPPGDCDPWDRYAWLRLVDDLGGGQTRDVELARFITPYDITGPGSYPGSCRWVYDVTDYKFMLKDLVTLKLYIESWIGGDKGWLITCDFAFIGGYSELQPFEVVNLWLNDYIVYGDGASSHEAFLPPVDVDIPADAVAGKVRVTCTGHGQGNTDNCAEFCAKDHSVVAGTETFTHLLFQGCAGTECSPQGGTWQYPRAGWCPGDKVTPWDNDVTTLLVPGQPFTVDYNIEPYFNDCSPDNPDCVSGQTCADCDYNYNGHTQPNWKVMGQLILYRYDPTATPEGAPVPKLELGQNYPNPFNPVTTFYYEVREPGDVTLRIISAGGRLLRELHRHHDEAGSYHYLWDGRNAAGDAMPSGVYFYEVQMGGHRQARKMIMLQ